MRQISENEKQSEAVKPREPACECCPWQLIKHNPCSDRQNHRNSFDRELLTLRFYEAADHDRERIEGALNVALNTVGIGVGLASNNNNNTSIEDMCKESEMDDETRETAEEETVSGWTIHFQHTIGKIQIQGMTQGHSIGHMGCPNSGYDARSLNWTFGVSIAMEGNYFKA